MYEASCAIHLQLLNYLMCIQMQYNLKGVVLSVMHFFYLKFIMILFSHGIPPCSILMTCPCSVSCKTSSRQQYTQSGFCSMTSRRAVLLLALVGLELMDCFCSRVKASLLYKCSTTGSGFKYFRFCLNL